MPAEVFKEKTDGALALRPSADDLGHEHAEVEGEGCVSTVVKEPQW